MILSVYLSYDNELKTFSGKFQTHNNITMCLDPIT